MIAGLTRTRIMKSFYYNSTGAAMCGFFMFVILGVLEFALINAYVYPVIQPEIINGFSYQLITPVIIFYFLYFIYTNIIYNFLNGTSDEWVELLQIVDKEGNFMDESNRRDLVDSTLRQLRTVRLWGITNSILLITVAFQLRYFSLV